MRRAGLPYFTKSPFCEISLSVLSSSFNSVKYAGNPPPQTRAGQFVVQPTGFRAFIPAPLPPDPQIQRDQEMDALLSAADTNLGRLDGVASILPDPGPISRNKISC